MRWALRFGCAALLGALPTLVCAEDAPKGSPAKDDVPSWQREADDIERRAAEAVDRQDLEAALALRRDAVALLRAKAPQSAALAGALNQHGGTLDALGRPRDALPLKEESLALCRQLFKGDQPDVAACVDSVAHTLGALGRSAEALSHHEESLAMYRRLFRGDHPQVATGINNVAYTLDALGRSAEALPLHEESLAMHRRLFGGDHHDIATAINNLAYTLDSLGRSADAMPLYEESLAMRRRLFEGDHSDVATSLNNVASTLGSLGRSAEALPLYEESLAMFRRLFQGDHPQVATALSNVASTLDSLGRSAEALLRFDESLAMRRRLFRGDHPDVAASLNNVAGTLASLGRSAEALSRFEESLAMYRRLLRGDHPNVATALGNVAFTLGSLGRSAEELPLFEESLAMRRRLFNGDHPDVAASLSNVAHTLGSLGRSAEALPLHEESLAMYRRLFKSDHPDVAAGLNSVAHTLGSLGRPAEALPLSEESLAMRRRLFKGDHPNIASSLNNVAYALGSLGRPAEVLPLCEESLAMRRRLFKGDHPDVAASLNNVAYTLGSLGRSAEALPLFDEAYSIALRLGPLERYRFGTSFGGQLVQVGHAIAAVGPLTSAVEALESIRLGARDLRSEERSRLMESLRDERDPYALLLRTHVALGDRGAALADLERGRGREMLDLLLRGQTDPLADAKERAHGTGDRATFARIEEVERARSSAEAGVLVRERETEGKREKAWDQTESSLAELRAARAAESKARRDLLDVLSKAQRLVRDVIPAARPLSTQEIQALLAKDERLLAYSVAGDVSYAFLVARDSIDAIEIPTKRIADDAEAYRGVLTDSSGDAAADGIAKGRRLFETVVPPSVWKSLQGVARVYVMADGVLNSIPFETLVVSEGGAKDGKPVYWADVGPPIAYEPAASVLSWLRTRPAASGERADLVAVGDPVFAGNAPPIEWPKAGVLLTEVRPGGQAERIGLRPGDVLVAYDGKEIADPGALRAGVQGARADRADIPLAVVRAGERKEFKAASGLLGVSIATESPDVAGPSLLAGGQLAIALRSAAERGRRLSRLEGTRAEVGAIEHAFQERLGDRSRTTALFGRDATEARLFETTKSPRYLHLATHGIADETDTASFSSLALTMPAVPVPGDDGFLTLVDLFSRWRGRLEGTDLVVLSACESGRGKSQRDEGMYALPWGFLYAGARAVVSSLWKVDDAATAFLMTRFYERLLAADGGDPVTALAVARNATKAKYPHPRYWGAFVFSGAPR